MKRNIDETYLLACAEILIQKNLTIAFAESATAAHVSDPQKRL